MRAGPGDDREGFGGAVGGGHGVRGEGQDKGGQFVVAVAADAVAHLGGEFAAGAVGLALMGTGAIVGVLSGASPLKRALRQLAIGFGAAGATYLLGLLFGATLG